MSKENRVFYTYAFPENLTPYVLCLTIMGLALTLGLFAGWVIVASSSKEGGNILANFGALLLVAIVVGIACSLSLLLINLYPSFWISQEGLIVRTFPLGNKLVPWNDIIRISPFILSNSQLVVLNHLTFIHRLVGVFTGLTPRPCFRIKRSLLNYQDAIEAIQGHLHS